MASTTVAQFGLGVLAPFVTAEFALSRTHFGSALSLLFLSGLVVSLAAGRVVRRWRETALLRFVCLVVICAFGVLSAAQSWWWVLAAAVVFGIPLGLGNPVTNELIIRRVDRRIQGTATGVKQAGVQIGALTVGAAVPPLAVAFGWRIAAAALALVAVAGLAMSFSLGRPTESSGPRVGGPSARPGSRAWYLGGYATLMGFGTSAVFAFLPLFAHDELGLPANRAGQLVALIGLVGAIARVALGMIGNRVRRLEPWLGALAAVSAGGLLLLVFATSRPGLVWVTAAAFGATAVAWQAPAMLAVVRDHQTAARSTGIVMSGFLTGMIVGPLSFGWLADRASYAAGWVMLSGAYAVASMLAWWCVMRDPSHESEPI